MNTEENNKRIAEFMGFTQEKNIGWYDNDMFMSQNVYDIQDGNCFDELQFHKSWDWLMPVVDKIFSLGYDYEIKPRYLVIKERLSSEVLVSKCFVYDKSQKEIIYDSVVEFINQYNNNESTD